MKQSLKFLVLIMMIAGAAGAQPQERELGLLAETRSKLKNVATALEMWSTDHQGAYPERLEQLVDHYLIKVPEQLDGSQHWNYQRNEKGYRLSDRWSGFAGLGVGEEVVYTSDRGLQALDIAYFPKESDLPGWQRKVYGNGFLEQWTSGPESITLQLRGPNQLCDTPEQARARHIQWMSRRHDSSQGKTSADIQPLLEKGWQLLARARYKGQRYWLVGRGDSLLEVRQECNPDCPDDYRVGAVAALINRL